MTGSDSDRICTTVRTPALGSVDFHGRLEALEPFNEKLRLCVAQNIASRCSRFDYGTKTVARLVGLAGVIAAIAPSRTAVDVET